MTKFSIHAITHFPPTVRHCLGSLAGIVFGDPEKKVDMRQFSFFGSNNNILRQARYQALHGDPDPTDVVMHEGKGMVVKEATSLLPPFLGLKAAAEENAHGQVIVCVERLQKPMEMQRQ